MHPHRAEDWAELRCVGRWRFIVSAGVRAAIATAFSMIVFGLSVVAYWAYRDGQALDFHWFQIAGEPGASSFLVYRHALAMLPVGFLFALVFWLVAGAKCWWLNESVHREALAKRNPTYLPAATDASRTPAAVGPVILLGQCVFVIFFVYLPLANNWPALRLAPPWEEVLFAAGFAGAALVWGISFAAWLVNLAKTTTAFALRLVQRGAGQQPNLPLINPTLGPAEPRGMEQVSPSLKRHRICFYVGTTLLVCAFVLASPLGFFPGTQIFDWTMPVGVSFLLAGVGFAAYGSYTELQKQSQQQASQKPLASAEAQPATVRQPVPFWMVLLMAAILFAGFSKILGLW